MLGRVRREKPVAPALRLVQQSTGGFHANEKRPHVLLSHLCTLTAYPVLPRIATTVGSFEHSLSTVCKAE
jgi:hypothetical protein